MAVAILERPGQRVRSVRGLTPPQRWARWRGIRDTLRDASRSALATPEGGKSALPDSGASAVSAAYEGFIREHERQILNYLWRMTGDEQSAYDLTQEVFLRAWQHFAEIRVYEQPRAWLFRVATNLALTHLRRRTMTRQHVGALTDAAKSASDPAWRLAERDLVRSTLLQLSPKRRAALTLREVYGLSAAEVGQVLGMSETAVRMALHRGREQFREIYLREGGSGNGA